MDFIDRIQEVAARIPKQRAHIQTEEATKNAFVMPFIAALGFDVFNPTEVVPEFIADVGMKKGEKVDYAIMIGDKPIMLFECKWSGADLDKVHASQLARYFAFTDARFGVLTNGVQYRFFSDLDKPNAMDEKPFFELDMENFTEAQVEELKKFTKPRFDLDGILATASELKYTREIKRLMAQEWQNPSEDFVKFFARRAYSGMLTQTVRERFTKFTKSAAKQFLNDRINERLTAALTKEAEPTEPAEEEDEDEPPTERQIVTSKDELEGYFIVKTIAREVVDAHRIAMRDTLSYCGVLFDDNSRKPVCRLHFNRPQKYVSFFDEEKSETKLPIETIDDIYEHAHKIRAVVQHYESMS